MGLLTEEMDLTEYAKPGDVEQTGLPPGWYRALVMDVRIDEKSKGALLFEFEVIDGPQKGRKISERLWNPKHAASPEAADTSKRRRANWAKRLGLVAEQDFGKPGVPVEWDNAIGRTFVIEVKNRKYTDKDGNQKEGTQIDFAGVYPTDHEKVPEHLRGPNPNDGATPASGGGGGSGGGTQVVTEGQFAGI